jgi:hypothetical protein
MYVSQIQHKDSFYRKGPGTCMVKDKFQVLLMLVTNRLYPVDVLLPKSVLLLKTIYAKSYL